MKDGDDLSLQICSRSHGLQRRPVLLPSPRPPISLSTYSILLSQYVSNQTWFSCKRFFHHSLMVLENLIRTLKNHSLSQSNCTITTFQDTMAIGRPRPHDVFQNFLEFFFNFSVSTLQSPDFRDLRTWKALMPRRCAGGRAHFGCPTGPTSQG